MENIVTFAGNGLRFYFGTGSWNALRFGLWNGMMLGIWAFGITSGVLLSMKLLG